MFKRNLDILPMMILFGLLIMIFAFIIINMVSNKISNISVNIPPIKIKQPDIILKISENDDGKLVLQSDKVDDEYEFNYDEIEGFGNVEKHVRDGGKGGNKDNKDNKDNKSDKDNKENKENKKNINRDDGFVLQSLSCGSKVKGYTIDKDDSIYGYNYMEYSDMPTPEQMSQMKILSKNMRGLAPINLNYFNIPQAWNIAYPIL